MGLISFFVRVAARWLKAGRVLLDDARAGYRRAGWRGVLFELEMGASVLRSLVAGSPLIYAELLELTKESANLRAAWDNNVAPEAYIRRRCEQQGIEFGSSAYLAAVAWAWAMVNYWERNSNAV